MNPTFPRVMCTLAVVLVSSFAHARSYTWTGMRAPCKVSAEDGLNEKQLGKKIGKFVPLENKDAWANAIFNVNNRFPGSKPWVTWAVGDLKDAKPELTDAQHEEYLKAMDDLGVEVYLELWPSGADVPALIDAWLGKLKHHPSVKGLGVDLEYYKPKLDDATAKAWDERVKSHNPTYRMFFKHWEESRMPPTYRGKGDVIFINMSSEATVDALNKEFAAWANHFAPNPVAFQIGYPSDEDGMDGNKDKGWFKLKDPIKDWGDALIGGIQDQKQEVGLLWVTVRSGKTYNANWDLTKGATLPPKK